MPVLPISNPTCIIRNTGAAHGRTLAIEPGKTAVKHLRYGRIVLDGGDAPLEIATGGLETGLIALAGEAAVHVDGVEYQMRPYDSLYVPRDTAVRVAPGTGGCDLAEIGAPVERRYPIQFVSFDAVQRDPGLHFEAGGSGARAAR